MWPAETKLWIVVGARHVYCGRTSQRHSAAGFVRLAKQLIDAPERMDTPQSRLLHALDAAVHVACEALRSASQQSGRIDLRAVVSDRWAPLQTLPWSPALAQPDTAQRYARDHIRTAGFDLEPADTVRVADAGYLRQAVAAAYGAELIVALHGAAQRLSADLVSVQPLNDLAWRAAQKRAGGRLAALAVVDEGRISLLHARRGDQRWMPGQTVTCAEFAAVDSLTQLWRRQQLRKPQLSEVSLEVFGFDRAGLDATAAATKPVAQATKESELNCSALTKSSGRDAFSSALDAIQRGPVLTPPRALAVCTALAVAATAVWQAVAATQAVREQQQAIAVRQLAVAPAPPKAWAEADRSRVRAINAAIRELNLPLPALARAMLPPRDIDVVLVALDIAPVRNENDGRPTLSIKADAASAIDMTRYVSFLSGRPTIANPHLVAHEILEWDAAKPYRFTVEMSWQN